MVNSDKTNSRDCTDALLDVAARMISARSIPDAARIACEALHTLDGKTAWACGLRFGDVTAACIPGPAEAGKSWVSALRDATGHSVPHAVIQWLDPEDSSDSKSTPACLATSVVRRQPTVLGALAAGWVGREGSVEALQAAADNAARFLGPALDALARIATEAHRDVLTGLYNRRFFNEALDRHLRLASRHAIPLGLLLIDIDEFKAVNDRHGHAVGDAALVKVAAILQATVRTSDLVCRYGGDEFVIVAPHTLGDGLEHLVERIDNALSAHTSITVSQGRGSWAPHEKEVAASALLAAADADLCRRKQVRSNRPPIQ